MLKYCELYIYLTKQSTNNQRKTTSSHKVGPRQTGPLYTIANGCLTSCPSSVRDRMAGMRDVCPSTGPHHRTMSVTLDKRATSFSESVLALRYGTVRSRVQTMEQDFILLDCFPRCFLIFSAYIYFFRDRPFTDCRIKD